MRRSTPRLSRFKPLRKCRGIAFGSISNSMESDVRSPVRSGSDHRTPDIGDVALSWEIEFRRCRGALRDFPRCSAHSFTGRNNGVVPSLPGAHGEEGGLSRAASA